MTRPKISPDQAQKLLETVRYTLNYHEWCVHPSYTDSRCGGRHHPIECDEIDSMFVDKNTPHDGYPCEGCRARTKAVAAAKWS